MAKLLLCFKPMRDNRSRSGGSLSQGEVDGVSTGSPDYGRQTVAHVELLKHSNEPLGLVLHGGKDQGVPVQVGAIRPGGVAAKSGALQPSDWILGINGVPTQHFTHAEVNTLLQNSGNVINLEIAFDELPDSASDDSTRKKTAIINLPLENDESNSYGFTISGGRTDNRPITVSNVTLDTTAYRNGFLKAGDHILKVNGVDLTNASQKETIALLKSSGDMCSLEIQYDVPVHNVLTDSQGPMLVELLKPRGVSLGVNLQRVGNALRIYHIKEAGIADRCGALHVGDGIVSLNELSLDGKSVKEAYKMLKHCDFKMHLEILPAHNFPEETFEDTESTISRPPSFSSPLFRRPSQMSVSSAATSTQQTCHPESMLVSLTADEVGFGLSLHGGATEYNNYPIAISSIEDGGPAARLGQLQVEDRVLAINGIKVDSCTLQQAVKLVKESGHVIELEIMFDVQDAIVPTSSTFDVKLVKTASLNLGIIINGSTHPGEQIWISKLKKGGIAYRTGMLVSGDILLAINNVGLENATVGQAAQMLKDAGDVVTLKVSKEAVHVPEVIVYSVMLHRNQQNLGITLSGTEQPGHPIFISKIKEDGVAYKTGALKVGDSVLAINGQSLVNATVPDAVHMLREAGDVVQLKIRKSTSRSRRGKTSPTGKMHRPGFYGGRGASRLSSRMEGQESYRRLLALRPNRPRRLSQTTIATSVSGRSTPDNHSMLSMDQSSYNGSFYGQQLEPSGRDSTLSQLTPSEFEGSAFSRPNSVLSNSGHGRYGYYNGYAESGRAGYSFAPSQSSAVDVQRRTSHSSPLKDIRSETDEELSQYGWEESQWPKRPAFYNRPGSKKWDFKSNRRRPSSFKIPKLIGRVSPLTPSEPPILSSSPPSLQRLATNIPPSPIKDQLGLCVSDNSTSEEPKLTSQESQEQEGTRMTKEVVVEIHHSNSKLSSADSGETERHECGGNGSISRGESTPCSPELSMPTLACAAPDPRANADSTENGPGEWPQSEILPGYEESPRTTEQRAAGSPTATSTVSVLKSPVAIANQSPTSSMERKTRSPKLALLEMDETTARLTGATTSPTQSVHRVTIESPRRTSAPDASVVKTKHQGHDLRSKSASTFEPSTTMQDCKRTILKANEFEKAMRALAESGSSDQDSDSEPHGSRSDEVSAIEQEKVQEKMRATIPYNQLKHVEIKRKPGASFGFSLADGCYDPGIFVKAVKEGSPADKAGLQPFDIILRIGDKKLQPDHTCESIDPLLKQCGDHLKLFVARQHQQVTGESYC